MARATCIWCIFMVLMFVKAQSNPPFYYCEAPAPSPKSYKALPNHRLALLQVVARHGDRTPINTFPVEDVTWNCDLDLYRSVGPERGAQYSEGAFFIPKSDHPFAQGFWEGNCTTGQLTMLGYEQQRSLGSRLREVYVDGVGFLGRELDPSEVLLRSTDVPRTQQSAESLLLGLYPARHRPQGVAVPLWRKPYQIEDMIANKGQCPRVGERKKQLIASAAYQQRQQQAAPLRSQLEAVLGTRHLESFSVDFDSYMDNLMCRACHGKPLPCTARGAASEACVTEQMLRQVEVEGDWHYQFLYSDEEFAGLVMGSFVWDLTSSMRAALNASSSPARREGGRPKKIEIFGGHDTTVGPLIGLITGGMPNGKWPPYASNVVLELWVPDGPDAAQARSEPVVRVLYNGEAVAVKGCAGGGANEGCSFSQWQGDIDREFLRFDPALGWVWTNSLAAVGGVITLVMGFLLNRVLFKPDAKREE